MKLFDPHPGLMGCPVPLPEKVRTLAATLDGQSMTVKEAVEKIKAVISERFSVKATKGCILLYQGSVEDLLKHGARCNCWRVLRYKK